VGNWLPSSEGGVPGLMNKPNKDRINVVQTRRTPIKNKKGKIALIHVENKTVGITDEG
jgi:hypothetical protein